MEKKSEIIKETIGDIIENLNNPLYEERQEAKRKLEKILNNFSQGKDTGYENPKIKKIESALSEIKNYGKPNIFKNPEIVILNGEKKVKFSTEDEKLIEEILKIKDTEKFNKKIDGLFSLKKYEIVEETRKKRRKQLESQISPAK